ncbi:hypothetical protein FNV43_RR17859 [Rhamnella rubrinervis]|uniref:Protein EFFECTOR OF TRANSCRIPTION 2-like n=1 Tax=Rhamnella rubrinervis TaxID=2594499 RepID=A0A8K0DZL9_9ROSA|nr:hypothetical protein FNV43_RR17859 [Rhamnella rubrinervis]
MVKLDGAVVVSRLKREDCKRTKHDRDFCQWKILVGPSDWEDYSLGKDGAERYRVHNLPTSSSPGVYELAIAVSHTGLGRKIVKLDPERIVVVYLGQAENLRTRLQHYGRTGAHLGNSYSTDHPTDCKTVSSQKGPGLFEEILSRGYPIVFRWAPMQTKSDAHKTETKLLNTFDYAWNTSINGSRRPDDILQKLKKISSSSNWLPVIVPRLLPFSQKEVGIRIKASKLLSTRNNFNTCADEESPDIFSRVFKFGRSQPRLVVDRGGTTEENSVICGIAIDEDSVCRRPPVEGRKRCAEHKGMKINGLLTARISNSNVGLQYGVNDKRESDSHCAPSCKHNRAGLPLVTVKYPICESSSQICGFILTDGSPCSRQPLKGNKRCGEHKGRKVGLPLVTDKYPICESFSQICGFISTDGSPCSRQPLKGNKRCGEHKGRRAWLPLVTDNYPICESFSQICGFITTDGSPCSRQPLKGNKRCYQHKGRRIRKS